MDADGIDAGVREAFANPGIDKPGVFGQKGPKWKRVAPPDLYPFQVGPAFQASCIPAEQRTHATNQALPRIARHVHERYLQPSRKPRVFPDVVAVTKHQNGRCVGPQEGTHRFLRSVLKMGSAGGHGQSYHIRQVGHVYLP